MTGIIRLIDQAAYQQMAMMWQHLQTRSVISPINWIFRGVLASLTKMLVYVHLI